MPTGPDPYAVLGVAHGATDAAIHAAYRSAVRRTHPDAGGSAAEFEAVQEAYELLRDPAQRRIWDAAPRPEPARARARPATADADAARRAMEDLIAESQRLEDEARKLAGQPPRQRPSPAHGERDDGEPEDSISAVLRDAGEQLRTTASGWSRDLARIIRRRL